MDPTDLHESIGEYRDIYYNVRLIKCMEINRKSDLWRVDNVRIHNWNIMLVIINDFVSISNLFYLIHILRWLQQDIKHLRRSIYEEVILLIKHCWILCDALCHYTWFKMSDVRFEMNEWLWMTILTRNADLYTYKANLLTRYRIQTRFDQSAARALVNHFFAH